MERKGLSIGAGALVFVASLIVLTNTGVIGIDWPWEKVDLPDPLTEETRVAQPEEATIIEIAPIALDCRARIHAKVPVKGTRDHKVVGQTYRTDTVTMTAIGDIDTCVSSDATEVIRVSDTSFRVLVPAEAITFERPRVDTVATRESVSFDKGFVGKFTDVLPWVSDDSGLTPAAYAFAQQVVGSSECMERAWNITEVVIKTAYRDELARQGGEANDVQVDIVGVPDFGEPPAAEQDGFSFEVSGGGVTCRVDGEAYDIDVVPAPEA